jgi:hypothetical protein
MESSAGPGSFNSQASGTVPRETIRQEGVLVHIPESAVANHGGEAIVERDATRRKRRPSPVAQNGDPAFVDIVPRRQVVHHVADRGFQIGTPDHLRTKVSCHLPAQLNRLASRDVKKAGRLVSICSRRRNRVFFERSAEHSHEWFGASNRHMLYRRNAWAGVVSIGQHSS